MVAGRRPSKIKVPKKSNKGDLPTTAEGWVRYVNNLHETGLQVRRKFEFQWILNIAYFMGYQDLVYNNRSGLIEIPKTMARPLTINRIGSFIEARHAKLLKNRPTPRVIPNTNDKEDLNAAKFSGHALSYLWRKIDMEEEYDDFVMLGLIFGTVFMRTMFFKLSC